MFISTVVFQSKVLQRLYRSAQKTTLVAPPTERPQSIPQEESGSSLLNPNI